MPLTPSSIKTFKALQRGEPVAGDDVKAAFDDARVKVIPRTNVVNVRFGGIKAALPAQAETLNPTQYPVLRDIATLALDQN